MKHRHQHQPQRNTELLKCNLNKQSKTTTKKRNRKIYTQSINGNKIEIDCLGMQRQSKKNELFESRGQG